MVYLVENLGKHILVNREKGTIIYKMSKKQKHLTELFWV